MDRNKSNLEVDIQNETGVTALMSAAQNGHREAAEVMMVQHAMHYVVACDRYMQAIQTKNGGREGGGRGIHLSYH